MVEFLHKREERKPDMHWAYQCPLRMGAAHRGGKEVNTRLSKIVRGIQQLGGVKPVKETRVSMTETLNGESFPAGLRSFSQMTFR